MIDPIRQMLPHEIAELLEGFATDVERLPGVSRTNPHAWGEAKSDLVHAMRCRAKVFRTVPVMPKPLPVMRPGSIEVGRRSVAVEVRGRRRA